MPCTFPLSWCLTSAALAPPAPPAPPPPPPIIARKRSTSSRSSRITWRKRRKEERRWKCSKASTSTVFIQFVNHYRIWVCKYSWLQINFVKSILFCSMNETWWSCEESCAYKLYWWVCLNSCHEENDWLQKSLVTRLVDLQQRWQLHGNSLRAFLFYLGVGVLVDNSIVYDALCSISVAQGGQCFFIIVSSWTDSGNHHCFTVSTEVVLDTSGHVRDGEMTWR